jgi:hypothetical protein
MHWMRWCGGGAHAGGVADADADAGGGSGQMACHTCPPQVLHQRSTLDQGAFILTPIALLFACFVAVPLLHQVLRVRCA